MIRSIPIFVILISTIGAYAQKSNTSGGKLENVQGYFALQTDLVENGISQTKKNPAILAGFNYTFGGTGKLGIQGSSVNFPATNETVNIRPYLSYKFFGPGVSDITIKVDWNRYYPVGDRDGLIMGFAINAIGYVFSYDTYANWEGTQSPSSHYHFSKEWNIPWGLIYGLRAGYNQVSGGYNNYFDVLTGLKYRFSDIDIKVDYMYNSASAQFSERADMHYFITILMRY